MQVTQLPLTQIVDFNTSTKFFVEKPIEDRIKRGTDAVGRWTKEEHDRFLEGINLYGKEWKKIASLIRTRTVVQVRTHAQKYFQKVTKSVTTLPKVPSVQQPMKRNADGSVKRSNTQLNIPTSCNQNINMSNTRMIHQQSTSNYVRQNQNQNQNQNQMRIKKSAINSQPTTPLVIMQQMPVGQQQIQPQFQQCQPLINQSFQQQQISTSTPPGNSPVSVTNLEFFNSNNLFKEFDDYDSNGLNNSLSELNEPVFTIPPSYVNDSQDYYSLSEDFSFTSKRIRTNSVLGDENDEEFEKLFDYYNNNSNSSTAISTDSI